MDKETADGVKEVASRLRTEMDKLGYSILSLKFEDEYRSAFRRLDYIPITLTIEKVRE